MSAMNTNNKNWYVVYTKPRWEKKVHDLMQRKGIESYCPLNKVHKKWTDRTKVVEEPLFKSYVFVHIPESEMTNVRFIDGVVNYVYWLGKPAKMKEYEIVRIKKFLNEYTDVMVEKIEDPKPGDKVLITSGVFMEHEGTVLNADRKKVEIRIDSLQYKLVAHVDREKIHIK